MNLNIEFKELERKMNVFYKTYQCKSCFLNCTPQGFTECRSRTEIHGFDIKTIKELKDSHMEKAKAFPPEQRAGFHKIELKELEDIMNADIFFRVESNVKTVHTLYVDKKKTKHLSFEDKTTKLTKDQVLEDYRKLDMNVSTGNYIYDALRYYYILWKHYKWVESLTMLSNKFESRPSKIKTVKQTDFNKPSLSRDSQYLLFWHLKDQKVFMSNLPQQTVNDCFEALTGYSAKQAKKVLNKPQIESEIQNKGSFDNLIVKLEQVIKKLKEQKENVDR